MDNSRKSFFPAILHGADYNPRQWSEEVWDEDMRLMKQANVNVATLPVFDWVHLQPSEDVYTFDWLDKILDKLHANGIWVCLATATASQPAWMDKKYPDILHTPMDGRKRGHGGRQNICPNSPNFRRLSAALVRKMAERYKNHPAVLVWHISNEYGAHCYCDICAEAFRNWLRERYGTLEEVNRRWNTTFWGHTYTDWAEIEPPSHMGDHTHQGMRVDYDRFQSDSVLGCYKNELAVLREITPNIPITTNLMGAFKPLDYHKWAKEMDIVSWDSYPWFGQPVAGMAFHHALIRGLKDGDPFMLMEQTPSQQNWQAYNALKRPGVMRLWSYQAMAHGADTVMYFQWRRSQGGTEKFHGAIVEHVGTETPRVFKEVSQLGAELRHLGQKTMGARVPSKVAVLFDWENWWAIEYSSGPTVSLKYHEQCISYYSALHAQGIPVEVVSPESDLSRYDIVIAPVLYMVKPGVAERIKEFTKNGGTFVTTFMSGIADETDLVYLGGYPGPLRELLGIWVEEIDALPPDRHNEFVFNEAFGELKGSYQCTMLYDILHTEGAKALATYGQDFYAGTPCLTVNNYGSGKAYYLASALNADALKMFMAELCKEKGLASPIPGLPEGVEASVRVTPEGIEQTYLLNHTNSTVKIQLPKGSYQDLITDKKLAGEIEMTPYGVLILTAA